MLEKNEGDDIGNDNEGTYVRSLAVLSFVWDRKANLPKKKKENAISSEGNASRIFQTQLASFNCMIYLFTFYFSTSLYCGM